jgi:uncharacterized protein YndB with AHSA1/START domain
MTNENTTLRLERIIDATPDAVFDAWTSPDAMEIWYRDGDDWDAKVIEHDLRVGGGFRIEWGPAEGPKYNETGKYVEIDRPHRLVILETLEGQWQETKLTLTFEAEAGKTRLTLVHEGFPSQETRDGARGGWPGFIDRLERIVTR